MNLDFTDADRAFRQEVRDFLRDALPADLRRKMIERRHLSKADITRWQRIVLPSGVHSEPVVGSRRLRGYLKLWAIFCRQWRGPNPHHKTDVHRQDSVRLR